MNGPRIGGLFAGYGGLEMGVQTVLGGELAWYADCCKFDKDGNASHYEPHREPCSIQAHHNPGVPNIGDVTKVDWSTVEPVDVLTGGSPCQDLSHAGKRAGMTEGTRSNLWVAMREAIARLRPGLVVWENVRGAYSAEADSDLEFCAGCMGDAGRRGPVLRALGRVLGDLSDLGYDAGWHGIRAADVGAPHGRFRVFVAAYPRELGRDGRPSVFGSRGHTPERGEAGGHAGDGSSPQVDLSRHTHGGTDAPECTPYGAACPPSALLPTPRATDGTKGGPNQRGSSGDLMLMVGSSNPAAHGQISGQWRDQMAEALTRWGDYAPAITRWEHTIGRPAPAPTMTSTKGNPQLAPTFVEWMMGLPAGWVTDVPGITRNEALKALGNGVVPQQAEAALRFLLPKLAAGVAA